MMTTISRFGNAETECHGSQLELSLRSGIDGGTKASKLLDRSGTDWDRKVHKETSLRRRGRREREAGTSGEGSLD